MQPSPGFIDDGFGNTLSIMFDSQGRIRSAKAQFGNPSMHDIVDIRYDELGKVVLVQFEGSYRLDFFYNDDGSCVVSDSEGSFAKFAVRDGSRVLVEMRDSAKKLAAALERVELVVAARPVA